MRSGAIVRGISSTLPHTSMSTIRYFISYTGVKLPLRPVNEIHADETDNRNTFFRCTYDASGHLSILEKLVYGELEMKHEYAYHDNGSLKQATITDADEEVTELQFAEDGTPIT